MFAFNFCFQALIFDVSAQRMLAHFHDLPSDHCQTPSHQATQRFRLPPLLSDPDLFGKPLMQDNHAINFSIEPVQFLVVKQPPFPLLNETPIFQ